MYQNPPTEHSQRKEKRKKRGIYEKYGIEVNVAVDVVVDVLGEPEILGGSEAVHWGQIEVIVAISSHCLLALFSFSFSFTFVFLLLSLSHLLCLAPAEWDLLGVLILLNTTFSAIWLFYYYLEFLLYKIIYY